MRLFAALACLTLTHLCIADTIHSMQGGGYYHHQSGSVQHFDALRLLHC